MLVELRLRLLKESTSFSNEHVHMLLALGVAPTRNLEALKKTIKSASDEEFLPWTNAIVLFKKLHIIL